MWVWTRESLSGQTEGRLQRSRPPWPAPWHPVDLAATAAAFAPTFSMYCLFRFLAAFTVVGTTLNTFILHRSPTLARQGRLVQAPRPTHLVLQWQSGRQHKPVSWW